MSMKCFFSGGIIFFAISLCFVNEAFAQKSSIEDELLSKKEISVKEFTSNEIYQNNIQIPFNNQAIINQTGNKNNSSVNQQLLGGSDPNSVVLIQSGNMNTSNLNQMGNGLNSVIDQDGNKNSYEGFINGSNIQSGVKQLGNGNVINQELTGQDLNYEIIQDGNNNNLIHIDNGTGNTPPQIIQDGNNMNLKIEQR